MDGRETRDPAWRQTEREDEEDDLERCRDCGDPLDDGEGYAGWCGNCRDARDNRAAESVIGAPLETAETAPDHEKDDREPEWSADQSAGESPVDFTVCPLCGVKDPEIASEERLYAANHLRLDVAEDGSLTRAEWTVTEPAWESSITIRYLCDVCGETLPERYQEAIDAALNNVRSDDD